MLYKNLFILIGLVAIGKAKSESDYDQVNLEDIQRFLKSSQGDKDVSHRSHRVHHHKNHAKPKHENERNLLNIQTLNLILKHNNLRRDKEQSNAGGIDDARVSKILCAVTGSYGCGGVDDRNQPSDDKPFGGVSPGENVRESHDYHDDELNVNNLEKEATNDIELLLSDLEEKLLVGKNKELRCQGDRCGHDRNQDLQLRCNGDRCSLNRVNDGKERDERIEDLRCKGDRCGRDFNRKGDDRKKAAIRCTNDRCEVRVDDKTDGRNQDLQLRCNGDRCSLNRANDGKEIDDRTEDFRCKGDRCGRDFNRKGDDNEKLLSDLEEKLLVGKNKELRCQGDRCGHDRNQDLQLRCKGDRCSFNRVNDGKERDDRIEDLRCKGNRCGRDFNRKGDDTLRCRNNKCGQGRSQDNFDIDSDFKTVLDKYGKRYKINKELDAIVLDVDDLDEVLGTLNVGLEKQSKPDIQTSRIDKKVMKRKNDRLHELSSLPANEDLNDFDNENLLTLPVLVRILKGMLDLDDMSIDAALSYVTDPAFGSIEKHIEDQGIFLNREDRYHLQKLREGYNAKLFTLAQVQKLLRNVSGTRQIEVIPTKSNKIMIPVELWDAVTARLNQVVKRVREQALRTPARLLPLTMKQRMRLQTIKPTTPKPRKANAQVPFVLNIQGLGHVTS